MDCLRRLGLFERANQQDQVGSHDRPDTTRLLAPGTPGYITRGALYDMQDAAKAAGNRQRVRPAVAGLNTFDDTEPIVKDFTPGTGTNIYWADGSYSHDGGATYFWPDASYPHAAPQNPDKNYGASGNGFFAWFTNIWVTFWAIQGTTGETTGGTGSINLLDNTGAALMGFDWTWSITADADNNWTIDQSGAATGAASIPAFNAIKVSSDSNLYIELTYDAARMIEV